MANNELGYNPSHLCMQLSLLKIAGMIADKENITLCMKEGLMDYAAGQMEYSIIDKKMHEEIKHAESFYLYKCAACGTPVETFACDLGSMAQATIDKLLCADCENKKTPIILLSCKICGVPKAINLMQFDDLCISCYLRPTVYDNAPEVKTPDVWDYAINGEEYEARGSVDNLDGKVHDHMITIYKANNIRQKRYTAIIEALQDMPEIVPNTVDVIDDWSKKIFSVTFQTLSGEDIENIHGGKYLHHIVNLVKS